MLLVNEACMVQSCGPLAQIFDMTKLPLSNVEMTTDGYQRRSVLPFLQGSWSQHTGTHTFSRHHRFRHHGKYRTTYIRHTTQVGRSCEHPETSTLFKMLSCKVPTSVACSKRPSKLPAAVAPRARIVKTRFMGEQVHLATYLQFHKPGQGAMGCEWL